MLLAPETACGIASMICRNLSWVSTVPLARSGFILLAWCWWLLAWPQALARNLRLRQEAQRLAGLSDKALADIGVARGAIDHYVMHGRIVGPCHQRRRPKPEAPARSRFKGTGC